MSAEVREMFELNIESTAEWRSRKAVEYPEDSRNEQSSTALVKLLKYVRELSDNHAIFRALAYYSETEVDEPLDAIETEHYMLSRYGFGHEEDPESFLQDLAAELRKALHARPKLPHTP